MSSKTVKTALVVGAIAVGFAAIPAIGPSAFATKIGTAVGLSGTAAGLVGTFIVSAGSQLVLGAVNKKLAPNIDIPEIGTNLSQGTMATAKSGIAPHRIIYGKTRVGGTMVYAETTNDNDFLHMIITVAGHEINSITKIFFNEDEVPLTQDGSDSNGVARLFPSSGNEYEGKARIKKHLGTDSQAADADLVSEITQWTTDHRLRGIAYVYVRLDFDSDVYTNGVPNVTFEVEGRKVFDPRNSSTAFSTNPALCIRDYLLNERFGLDADASEINDTNMASVANTCDESVSLTSGTEKRFTMNGTFTVEKTPKRILENMLSTIGGHLIYSNGQFKLRPAVYESPTVTLTEEHIRSGISLNTRVSKKELFNAVKGLYSEPANNYQPSDYPILTDSTFESEDNSERIFGEFNFPMTTSSTTVQRLSKIQLLKARQQISFTAEFNLKAFQLDIGDTVQITNSRLGFSNKTFEISNWSFAMGGGSDAPIPVVSCEFRETASAVYDFATSGYSTISSGKATNLPSVNSVTAPTAVTLTDELVSYNDGTVIVKLVINLTAPSNKFTEIFEVEVRQDTDANGNALSPADDFKLIGRGARTKFEFLNVIDKATYTVRARGVNVFGAKSSTITSSRTIVGLIAPPSDVTNFACNIVGKEAHLSFDPVPDLDLSHYRINFTSDTTNPEWQNSIVLVKKLSRPGTSIVVPAKTGTYMIKAVDKLGNVSTNEATVTTLITTIGDFTDLITQNENPDFTGTTSDTVITTLEDSTKAVILDSDELFDSASGNFDSALTHLFDGGTTNKQVKSSGTYDFASTIDVGQLLTTHIEATLEQQVTDRDRIFDNVSGDFDAQPSNFDGDANTQSDAELQISTSNDNVTFSTFQDFVIGDYTARFYKFRLVLTSSNNSATPIVTAVGVKIKLEAFTVSENDVVSGTGTKSVTYPKTFNQNPAITLSIQNMASGDTYTISSKSTTGFNIAFVNSSGSGVSRTFDYVAKGV
jgi:hypothetical protein